MTVRILHTADNHIGLPFGHYPPQLRDTLVVERFDALERLVETANGRQADFLVIAGDLFDTTRVRAQDIRKTAGILRGFAGTAVVVVPGNHDHVAGVDGGVWKRFREELEGAGNIDLLDTTEVRSYDVAGQQVHFFPCPCPSKTGSTPTIGWVADAAREHSAGLRIGIAHGNVTGLGLDAEGQYFTMDPAALEAVDVATWLLGHIHVPFPTTQAGERSPYFMAGTHTPDSLRCRHPGSAWWIECTDDRVTRYERVSQGRIRFVRIERDVCSADDVAAVLAECRGLEAARTILDLQLSGRLSAPERAALDGGFAELRPAFLHVSDESRILDRIDAAKVAELYSDGGLAARLLTALLADPQHPDAATLAHELIEEARTP
ncbi:MAG: exonuclease SbcCD subunit D [Pirellulales bacterium]